MESVKAIKSKGSPVGLWVVKFGKYKGHTYEEIKRDDKAYLMYMMEQGVFNKDEYKETNDKIKEYICI